MIRFTGASQLDALAKRLDRLADVPKKARQKLANRAETLAKQVFSTKRDPYGRKWSRRKKAAAHPLMNKTGALAGGQTVRVTSSGFMMSNSVEYSGFHQRGTARMVARMLLPSSSRGLPSAWQQDFERIIANEFRSVL